MVRYRFYDLKLNFMVKIIALAERARVVVTNSTSDDHQRSLVACFELAMPKPLTTIARC